MKLLLSGPASVGPQAAARSKRVRNIFGRTIHMVMVLPCSERSMEELSLNLNFFFCLVLVCCLHWVFRPW